MEKLKVKQGILKEKGITLIALIITIIVLLILVGITINLTIGQGGMITRAQEAGKNYQVAEKNESEQLNNIANTADEMINKINDKTVPQNAEITFSASENQTSLPVVVDAQIILVDTVSGVNISKCRYMLNKSGLELGINPNDYTSGMFNSDKQNITLNLNSVSDWYLHVLTIDNAGNAIETIKGPINVEEIYHKHKGSTSEGGECYGNQITTPIYRTCTHAFNRTIQNDYVQQTSFHAGDICGQGLLINEIRYGNYTHSVNVGTSITYSLNCEKEEGVTLEGYNVSYNE